jgi:hypothetical protein
MSEATRLFGSVAAANARHRITTQRPFTGPSWPSPARSGPFLPGCGLNATGA